MIEDRLKETLDRAVGGGPDEAGAFDRFLRRRARRSRSVAAGNALVLVLVLASAVALPRLIGDAGQQPRLEVTGQPGPERWLAGPLAAVAPVQGFEVDVPAGWEASPTWKGLALRPVSPDLRRLLNVPVALDTTYLEAFYQPDTSDQHQDGSWLPRAAEARPRQDPQTRGRFPEGRGWFRTDGRDGRWHVTRWYVSWPYHCPAGRECPDVVTMRALRVAFQVDPAAVAPVEDLAERLLRSARPIANAVPGRAHAPRPDCAEGKSVVSQRLADGDLPPGVRRTVQHFRWEFRTTSNLVPCTVRGPVGVELVDRNGRRLDVQGNPLAVSPVGDLPEHRGNQGPGALGLMLKWYNWCGDGQAYLRWIGGDSSGGRVPIASPPCIVPAKPSVLAVDRRSS